MRGLKSRCLIRSNPADLAGFNDIGEEWSNLSKKFIKVFYFFSPLVGLVEFGEMGDFSPDGALD